MEWKKVTNPELDQPSVTGDYVVIDKRDPLPDVVFLVGGEPLDPNIVAYISDVIPEFEGANN